MAQYCWQGFLNHNNQNLNIIIIYLHHPRATDTLQREHHRRIYSVTHKLTHSFTSYYQMQEINNDNIFHHSHYYPILAHLNTSNIDNLITYWSWCLTLEVSQYCDTSRAPPTVFLAPITFKREFVLFVFVILQFMESMKLSYITTV